MTTTPDYAAITDRQRATWSDGDFNVLALNVMRASEEIISALDVHAGERVLDVACGSGNAALVAARRNADVTGIDYVPALIERAKTRAAAEGTKIDFRTGDAQELPFADQSFDAVVSVFGVMFAPDQQRAARELLRVMRSGGRVGLMNWMPEDFGGDFFRTHGKYLPPPAGLSPPIRWGTESAVRELFGTSVASLSFERFTFFQYFRSESHVLETFRTHFGPTRRVLASLEASRQADFERELLDVIRRYNRAKDGTACVESRCMRVLATKAAIA
jgi:ubiquinone/menaquinone biosynthesis C-methylase UbiE